MPDGVAARGAAKAKAEKAKAEKGKTERKPDSIFTKINRFLHESYVEVVKKAAWPTWPDLKRFTLVVIVAVVVVGLWIAGLDSILTHLTKAIKFGTPATPVGR